MSKLYVDIGPPASGQKVCLATTAYDGVSASYAFSIQRSREALTEAGIQSAYVLVSGNCHVDDSRNTAVQEFLLGDCTDLVFLDADVSWDAETLVELCQYDRDVVGGVYPYRRPGMTGAMPVRPLLSDDVIPGDGLIEVEGLPAGFLRIRRVVLERLAAVSDTFWGQHNKQTPVPLIFERTLEDGVRWGGDMEFCRCWRKLGGKVFAATEMRLGHAGETLNVDSLAAMARRTSGQTLRTIADAVREGRETLGHYTEAFECIGNEWAAPPDVLAICVALARKVDGPIIEAGSGLTTVFMAAATDQTVYCLEHDETWAERLRAMARAAGVGNIGLCVCPIADGWYDLTGMDLPASFALGLNDGPPRYLGNRRGFFGRLTCDTVVCDDADDAEYAQWLRAWAAEQGRTIDFIDRAALIRKGDDAKSIQAA